MVQRCGDLAPRRQIRPEEPHHSGEVPVAPPPPLRRDPNLVAARRLQAGARGPTVARFLFPPSPDERAPLGPGVRKTRTLAGALTRAAAQARLRRATEAASARSGRAGARAAAQWPPPCGRAPQSANEPEGRYARKVGGAQRNDTHDDDCAGRRRITCQCVTPPPPPPPPPPQLRRAARRPVAPRGRAGRQKRKTLLQRL